MTNLDYVDVPAYITLVVLGIIVCFWGKQLSRVISSIVFGAFLGYITWLYTFKLWSSVALSIVFMLIAMIVGFALGFIAFRLVLSIFFAYILTGIIVPAKSILFPILLIILATAIYTLSNYILSLLYAATGALMIYEGITTLGLEKIYAVIICLIMFTLGLYNQLRSKV